MPPERESTPLLVRNVLELKVVERLLDSGLKLQQARQAVECLRGDLGAGVASSRLVLVGTRSVLARSDEAESSIYWPAVKGLRRLPLSGVVSELEAAIVEIGTPPPLSDPGHPAAGYVPSAKAAER